MKPVKSPPAAIGYEKPFTLSFKGHLATQSNEDRAMILAYIEAFRESAVRLIQVLCSMERAGGDERIMAYLLTSPGVVPDDILAHPAWVAEVTRNKATEDAWKKLHTSSLFHLLRGVLVPDARETGGGAAMKDIFARYGLASRILTAEVFNEVFGRIDSDHIRVQLGNIVGGSTKAFLSARNNAIKLSRERHGTVQRLLDSDGAFFTPLMRMFQKDAAWSSASRHFSELRKALKGEGVPADVVAACQWRAVLNRPDVKAWQPDDRPDEEFLEIANLNPEILKRFETLIPAGFTAKDAEPHRFRHFMKDEADVGALAKEPFLISRLIAMYQAAYGTFSPAQIGALAHTGGREHEGWKAIAKMGKEEAKAKGKAKAAFDQATVNFYKFVTGPVREFCAAMRPVHVPDAPKMVDVWPLLSNSNYGWVMAECPAGSPSNMMHVVLYIPAHVRLDGSAVPVARISVSVRGNLPGANATPLPAPLDIANGPTQFRPDRYIAMPGDPSRRILLKHQALRLTVEESGAKRIFGSFASTLIAEVPDATKPVAKSALEERLAVKKAGGKVDASLYRKVGIGERMAVVHVGPGGMRVATLTVFQRVAADKDNPSG